MSKFIPHGTTVTIGSVNIGGLTGISTPDQTRGEAEQTDNASGGDREFLPGLRDNGTFSLEGRYDPEDAGQTAIRSNFQNDGCTVSEEIVITPPDCATADSTVVTITFDAFVTTPPVVDLPQDADDVAMFTADFRVDGAVTVAVA